MANEKTQQTEFFVSKGERQLGPWTLQELAARLASSEIAVTDFVFDDGRQDWMPLFECEALKAHLAQSKPKSAPKKAQASEKTVTETKVETSAVGTGTTTTATAGEKGEWFVQKGSHRYGPFSYAGVVRALQEKTVYEFDLIWREGMNEWVRIAQHDEFKPERIKAIAATNGEAIIRRQHQRMQFDNEVIVHDNRSVWLGRSVEGSAGGSGVVIENATLVPGQTVLLHFAAKEDLPAFNALCEIVGKKFVGDIRDAKTPVQYSVRFVKLDSQAEPRVQEYFHSRGAKAA
jgi:hypothetical protein